MTDLDYRGKPNKYQFSYHIGFFVLSAKERLYTFVAIGHVGNPVTSLGFLSAIDMTTNKICYFRFRKLSCLIIASSKGT
uniref:Uncharacterized protein n=1 Tax=Candidatus Kentrum sp. TUN TaxID=2126343 RepID=A0A450ZI34_9GAMM|nr:MAG: hypothetical protein BECKTUN1418E_GA0071001_10172 [Candidatus Kentron sp. TUN]